METPGPGGSRRMSRGVKLALMGIAGAAVLYSCAPAIGGAGGGLGALPYLWFLANPFFRGPAATSAPVTPGSAATSPGTTKPDAAKATPAQSQRGGFGSSGTQGGSTGSS